MFLSPDKLQEIRLDVDEFLYNHQELKIENDEQYTQAGDVVKEVAMKVKKLDAKRMEYTKPLDETKKLIMADFKSVTDPLEEFCTLVKKKMLDYYKETQQRKNEEQARIDAEALEKARQGNVSEVQVPIVNEEVKTQRGDVSTITIRKVWTFKITDETKIPRDYLVVDERKIREAIRNGERRIDGVDIFQEEQAPTIR